MCANGIYDPRNGCCDQCSQVASLDSSSAATSTRPDQAATPPQAPALAAKTSRRVVGLTFE